MPPGPVGVKEKAPPAPAHEPGHEYEQRDVPILVAGCSGGDSVSRALPAVRREASMEATRVAKNTGLRYCEYNAKANAFELRSLFDGR